MCELSVLDATDCVCSVHSSCLDHESDIFRPHATIPNLLTYKQLTKCLFTRQKPNTEKYNPTHYWMDESDYRYRKTNNVLVTCNKYIIPCVLPPDSYLDDTPLPSDGMPTHSAHNY